MSEVKLTTYPNLLSYKLIVPSDVWLQLPMYAQLAIVVVDEGGGWFSVEQKFPVNSHANAIARFVIVPPMNPTDDTKVFPRLEKILAYTGTEER